MQIKTPPVQTQPRPAPTKVAPPTPTFDTNENGKLAAIEEGKTSFRESALFYLIRLTEGKQWLWDAQPNTVVAEGWELVATTRDESPSDDHDEEVVMFVFKRTRS